MYGKNLNPFKFRLIIEINNIVMEILNVLAHPGHVDKSQNTLIQKLFCRNYRSSKTFALIHHTAPFYFESSQKITTTP